MVLGVAQAAARPDPDALMRITAAPARRLRRAEENAELPEEGGRVVVKHALYRLGAVSLALLGMPGCEGRLAPEIIDELHNSGADAPEHANADDPYGTCVLGGDSDVFPFRCNRPDTACTGWGGGLSRPCAEGSCLHQTFHVVCDHTCETADDCPVPLSGDVVPVCIERVHACQLPCDDDTSCPDGYSCQSTADWGLSDADGPIPLARLCLQTFEFDQVQTPAP
jgi:hypothetical protein